MDNVTIIDSDDYAASGISTLFFPGGEPHVKVPLFIDRVVLFHIKPRTWTDVGFAALVKNALREQEIAGKIERNITFCPYYPGARQDRSDGTAALTVEIMAGLLGRGVLFDVHSRTAFSHIGGYSLYWDQLTHYVPYKENIAGVIAPDGGAFHRAKRFRDHYQDQAILVQGTKKRNPETGHLSDYEIQPLTEVGHYTIVDDICDGGGTFNLLMQAIRRDPIGARSTFDLVVSHGIFSKGLENIHSGIEHITTTDSWCRADGTENATIAPSQRLTVIPLKELYPHLLGDSRYGL